MNHVSGLAIDGTPQGQCGSCWARASVKALEWLWGMDPSNPAYSGFSSQYVIDCMPSTANSHACDGGTPMDALDWLKTNPMLNLKQYPEHPNGLKGACQPPKDALATQPIVSAGWHMAIPSCPSASGNCDLQALQEFALLDKLGQSEHIILAYVDATNWQYYQDGVFDHTQCSNTMEAGNHVVEIVGAERTSLTQLPHWIISNSWGPSWGMGGNIQLPMGVNACGLMNFVIAPNPLPANARAQPVGAK